MRSKRKIYGGEHFLDINFKKKQNADAFKILNNLNKSSVFFRSGRDAFNSLIDYLEPSNIWLPNYICDSLWKVSSFKHNIKWYSIEYDFTFSREYLIEKTQKKDVVLLIATLGYKTLENLQKLSNQIDATIIVDLTHIVLDKKLINEASRFSDYQIFSLRKAFPILDGGLLTSSLPLEIKTKEPDLNDSFLINRSLGLLIRSTSIKLGLDDDKNLKLLKKAENILDKQKIYGRKISFVSRNLLKLIDYKVCQQQNKRNKNLLFKLIINCKNFSLLEERYSISLFVPLIFKSKHKRDLCRKILAEKSMFFPIHWPISDEIPLNKANHLSNILLSIPCDFRYSPADIKFISKTLIEIDKVIN